MLRLTKVIAVAFLKVALFDSKANEVLVRKRYLPRYQLVLDDKNRLKISTILFFWRLRRPR